MSGSIIHFTCDCGASDKAGQFTYDARPPYNMPRDWTTDRNGGGVCPTCSQAKRDATGFQEGDAVSWDLSGTTVYGRVRAVAIQRYGQVQIIVHPDGGTWRQQQSLDPNRVAHQVLA